MPRKQVVPENVTAVYRCQHSSAEGVDWLVNGSTFFPNTIDGIRLNQTSLNDLLLYELMILASSTNNGTMIVCRARFRDPERNETTESAELIVQGL